MQHRRNTVSTTYHTQAAQREGCHIYARSAKISPPVQLSARHRVSCVVTFGQRCMWQRRCGLSQLGIPRGLPGGTMCQSLPACATPFTPWESIPSSWLLSPLIDRSKFEFQLSVAVHRDCSAAATQLDLPDASAQTTNNPPSEPDCRHAVTDFHPPRIH